jgi:SAM-dependent methyltransferase
MRQVFVDEILNKVICDYDEIAAEFDTTRKHAWYEFEIYKELLRQGDKVLDLGCGNGRLYDYLEPMKVDYVGIDVSAELLNKARLKYRKKAKLEKVQFKKGGFLDIPYVRPVFDKIFCVASFHHLPGRKARLSALANMKSVLKKDGTVVISVWNLWQKKYRKYIWESLGRMHKYDFGDTFIPWGKSGVNRYYHAFTLYEMRGLLREAGFYLVDELMVKKGSLVESFFEAENFIFIAKPIINE